MSRILPLVFVTLAVLLPRPVASQSAAPAFTILVANDDGFDAPGLVALVDSLATIARVIVVAPATEESAMGHAITYRDPIFVREVPSALGVRWYAIEARPATVVRLALASLLQERPDLVVTGINSGANIGLDAWISGTVAGAREAALHGIPAIATSRAGSADYRAAAGIVKSLVQTLRERDQIAPGLLLNVNIPANVQGVRVVRMSLRTGVERYERRTSPRGATYYWDVWSPPEGEDDGTDLHAIRAGFVTITPLLVDQTAWTQLESLRNVLGGR